MSNPESSNNDELSPKIEKLLDAANSASQTVAALHVAFMAFAAYLGVIIWGTTHEDLLRNSPVKLPILDVELPLTTFYGSVPWLLVLLHFNLLMQLELLSRKLWNLDKELLDTPVGQHVRDRLFIFPFTHLIAGRSSVRLIRWLLSLVVGLTIIAMPLALLLAGQIRFLPYHDEVITWMQRGAVWIDAAMLLALWPLIASPSDQAREWWRNIRFRLWAYLNYLWYWVILAQDQLRRWIGHHWPGLNSREIAQTRSAPQPGAESKGAIILLTTMCVVLPLSIIAVIPGSIIVETYYHPPKDSPEDILHFEDWLIRHVPEAWLSVVVDKRIINETLVCASFLPTPPMKQVDTSLRIVLSSTCNWFESDLLPRNLDIKEGRLVPKEVSVSLLWRTIDRDKPVRDAALKEFEGLQLKGRDLRFADLRGSALPNADLRDANLQGAFLLSTKLQGSKLENTQLQGAMLNDAQLQGVNLSNARLQGVHLNGAKLQAAILYRTHLQGASLNDAQMQGASLTETQLQGANLDHANLQSALLNHVLLQGASLYQAQLQGAILFFTLLQGADLSRARLQGASLNYSKLQGANLSNTQLQGADMKGAELQAANLYHTQLQGINWSGAHLDGIFIVNESKSDWNEQQQQKLESLLKPLLKDIYFAKFRQGIDRIKKRMHPGEPVSQAGCYSDNPKLLQCDYREPNQLNAYRNDVLYPKLIELACSGAAIAENITHQDRSISSNDSDNFSFSLAAALIKELDSPKPCRGLAALSELTRQEIRHAMEKQKNTVK